MNGFRQLVAGIWFPVHNGFFIRQGDGYNAAFGGSGLLPEAAALIRTGMVSGIAYELWFVASAMPSASAAGSR